MNPTSEHHLEERVVELEARLAFQDDAITQLNDVVVAQREQLDRLERVCERLRARLAQLGVDAGGADDVDSGDPYERDRPPHY